MLYRGNLSGGRGIGNVGSTSLEPRTLAYALSDISLAVAGRGEMHHGIPSCQKASHVCHAEMGGAITDGGGEGGGERARTVDNKPEVTKLDYWGRQNQDVAAVTHLIRLTWSSSTAKLSNIGFNSAVPRTENWKSDGSSSVWLSLTCSLAEPRGAPTPTRPAV